MATDAPLVRDLGRAEVDGLLARNRVGRVAYTHGNLVDVEALPYVYDAPWICGRLRPGMKLGTTARVRFITFEVDEVVSPEEWSSVTVRGAFYLVAESEAPRERCVYQRVREVVDTALPLSGASGRSAHPVLFRIPAHHAFGQTCGPCAPVP